MKAQQLRNAVLQLAIQGKLVPQEPTDEPASVLLEKIKAEKKQLIKDKKIKKEKPLPEITDEEKPFDIPDSWEWVRLGEIAKNFDGKRRPVSIELRERLEKIYDYYGATGVIDKVDNFLFEGDYLLIGEDGGNFFVPRDVSFIVNGKFWANNHVHVLAFENFTLLSYIKYFINALNLPAMGLINGIAVPKLNQSNMNSICVTLPPLAEQQRIVAKIEEIMPLIEKYEKLEIELSKLEADFPKKLKKSILQYAVQGKLVSQDPTDEPTSVLLEKIKAEKELLNKDKKIKREKPLLEIMDEEKPFDIPDSWEWVRLGDIVSKLGSGSTPTGGRNVYSIEGIKFIRSQNVYNDGLRLNDIAYISEDINNRKKGSIVQAQDVLLNITGGSIGRCALVSDDFDIANVNQHVMIIRLVEKKIRHYIHHCITSNYIQDMIMDVQVGVSREGLSATKLSNFCIPLPPIAEQQRIIAKVDELMALCDILDDKNKLKKHKPSPKANKVIEFKPQLSQQDEEYAEEFDMVARAESISRDTQVKIAERIKSLRAKK